MTETPAWHPHATWSDFAPAPDASVAGIEEPTVRRAFDDLATIAVRSLRFTGIEGGDLRSLRALLRAARRAGLQVEAQVRLGIAPPALDVLADVGVTTISVGIHGPDARTHDRYRGVDGDFDQAEALAEAVRSSGVALEIRTNLHVGIARRMSAMADAVQRLGASRWMLGAPLARARLLDEGMLEQTLADVAVRAPRDGLLVVTHHAPFFLRLCNLAGTKQSCSTRDERNGLCILPSGDVTPDPAIPLVIGDIRGGRLQALFDEHPLLRALRDPDAVEGKCGRCDYRKVCGGSRARALAQRGNLFASDPACTYEA